MPHPHIDANPAYRLGVAKEILRQIADPASPLRLHERLHPGAVNERIVEFLATDDQHTPAPADPTVIPLRRVIANQVPWPAGQLCDLWPGDCVTHDQWGPGTINGLEDDDYADHLETLMGGTLLADFGPNGPRWVAANELTRTHENNPVY